MKHFRKKKNFHFTRKRILRNQRVGKFHDQLHYFFLGFRSFADKKLSEAWSKAKLMKLLQLFRSASDVDASVNCASLRARCKHEFQFYYLLAVRPRDGAFYQLPRYTHKAEINFDLKLIRKQLL